MLGKKWERPLQAKMVESERQTGTSQDHGEFQVATAKTGGHCPSICPYSGNLVLPNIYLGLANEF